jgi:uncharacterized protein (TIGR00725 family)
VQKIVSIIGSSVADAKVAKMAYDVGYAIAKRGYILACGGLGGVMEAACKGAKSANGTTIGFLPGIEKSDANPYVDIVIPTGIGLARNLVVVLAADVIVALSGGAGTLSEFGYAWQIGKPIVALAPSGGWAEKFAGTALDDRRAGKIESAHSADEVLHILEKYIE